ncbi:MAG: 2-oxoglutarate dehydrogenase E1 component [Phycisphaeraceae bacterium]|nr:2-oxoglutarate dehydrogenase E1 component [Phycisphaeraceae bacterium]
MSNSNPASEPSIPGANGTDILSLPFAEGLYEDFLRDPSSVPEDWRRYFVQITPANGRSMRVRPSMRPASLFNPTGANGHGPAGSTSAPAVPAAAAQYLQDRVDQLVRHYRVRGHMIAQIDPLGIPRPDMPELDYRYVKLTEEDLDRTFSTVTLGGADVQTLRALLQRLKNTYCRSIGAQFMHIDDEEVRQWLQNRMEGTENRIELTRKEQLRILTRLTDAVIFEEFIQKKFVGAKSFSLEGGESLIPLLDLAIEKAGEQQIDEIVLGMAHRGRLNVLANIMGKSPEMIFREFQDATSGNQPPRGDVKYHLGYSTDWTTQTGHKIHLSLAFNPSHLEYVNSVALGRMRAKMDRVGDCDRVKGMTLLIHGDAAFAGEGVVQETLNLSELDPYSTGGTLHVIVNNQVGFTTPPEQARSSTYATDIAKMLQSPIFHVNGEDCEAVAQVVRLAMDFRKVFKRDVVIDMYCFRRRGHNEGDEPSFTQPLMYAAMDLRKNTREGYLEHLLKLGGVTRQEADRIAADRHEALERELAEAREPEEGAGEPSDRSRIWIGYRGGREKEVADVPTGVPRARLTQLLEKLAELPEDFILHPKLARFIKGRRDMAAGVRPIDWSAGEALAMASLATDGVRVRMTGQDCERGTFSHRHAVLHDVEDGHRHMPLQHLTPDQAQVEIYNSPLSEAGVLGFEYGYSLDFPSALVIWEAQFGDFINAAQVIVDQFIVSAEQKWRRLSGLVLLLPHGFEGQGPEHSSARLERFLALASEDNIQVCNATTPAQYFHLLRRQVLRPWRKPLIVMSPKSLLRHPEVVSPLDDFESGTFQRVIDDAQISEPGKVKQILLCSGKIFYELKKRRDEIARTDTAIVRVEQYYPVPEAELRAIVKRYSNADRAIWVQEEGRNHGAWRFFHFEFGDKLFDKLPFTGIYRPPSASPATGSSNQHKIEQEAILKEALG